MPDDRLPNDPAPGDPAPGDPDAAALERFLAAPTGDRLRLARDPQVAPAVERYLGADAFGEYVALAEAAGRRGGGHLAIDHPTNLVFVPGVMGSMLSSSTKGGVWWIDARSRDHIDDLRLSPDGTRDADPNNAVVPFATDPSYEPFLTAALARDDFGHVTFPYDWRKPLGASARALRGVVLDAREDNGGEPVHLVAHSMGGLLVRAALAAHGDELWPALGRIVFIGTPHFGSPAIAGYLKNHLWGFELLALLGRYLSRATFRSLRGVLELLPAPRGVYPGTRPDDDGPWGGADTADYRHPCANFDLHEAERWKLDDLTSVDTQRLQDALDASARFHRGLLDAHRRLTPEQRARMLVIAGVGYRTLFRLEYRSHLLGAWESMAKETGRVPGDPHRDGDGRVPLASALLDDVEVRYVKGVHGGLPNIPAVYLDTFRWLNEARLRLPDTPAGALASHLGGEDEESPAPHLDDSARAAQGGEDPGVLDPAAPDDAQLAAYEAALDAGALPEFTRVRLL